MKDAILAAEHAAMHKRLPPDLFSGLLAISADAVIAVDDEQRIVFFNEGAERIFGWNADDVGGRPLEILLPERYRAAHHGYVHDFGAAHGRARVMGERQQLCGLRRNGDEFPCEAAIQRILVDGKNIFAAVLRDISARQRAEDALRDAVTAREDMLGIVSHDLRNPANAVKMLARSIIDDEAIDHLPPHVVERVKVIQQAAEQIDALIQDLLDTTRLGGGRLSVNPKAVNPTAISERSVEGLRPLADAGRVTLSVKLPAALPDVYADPDRMTQLLSNLIGNAIKFTPPGGSVSLGAHLDGDEVLFVVTDTGDGIAPDDLPHVFERFYRAETARALPGTGLGLAIVHQIVTLHGGSVA
ncbi:MAG: PAS domain-containing sensor histidine kinase, partial [Gemmatimonadota bacterium]|nr:PAS domain-containing sensor histidine kinase [Gemmatimonadota bacterium]